MQTNITNITKTFIKLSFIATFAFVAAASFDLKITNDFAFSTSNVAFADDGGGDSGGDGGCCGGGDSGSGWGGGYDAGTGSDYGNSIGTGGSDGGSSYTTPTYIPITYAAPTTAISPNPASIVYGNGSTLTWSSTNATSCRLNGGNFSNVLVGISGSVAVYPTATTQYSITCTGMGGTSTSYTTVTVTPVTALAPTADINSNPGNVNSGSASTISWSSLNATYCILNGGQFSNVTVGITGSYTVFPTANTTYTITCYNAAGQTATDSTTVTVTAVQNNPTATITANPSTIVSGNNTVLTWGSTNATYCKLNGGQFNNFTVGASGTVNAQPTANTTYTVTCYNDAGASANANTTVTVTNNNYCSNGATNPPTCNICPAGMVLINNVCTTIVNNITADINVNPGSVYSGNAATLSWTSTNATYCVLNGGVYNNQNVTTSGSYTVYPTANTNYSINCYNGSGQTATDNAYVTVNTATNLPTVTISPSSYVVNSGSNVSLYWSSTNATYCSATPWPFSGSKNTAGTESVVMNNTTTFTITCFNSAGQSAQAQTTVTVNTQSYVYCNGVQYPAGTVCPNTNNVGVSTTGANPMQTTANIFGYVNPNGTNATMWFEYGTNANSLIYSTTRQYTGNAGQFNANLSGLACGTTYYYRAVAQNSTGTQYGSTQSFVTTACSNNTYVTDTVATRPATLVSQYQGQLNGSFIAGNTYSNNTCGAYFEYGTSYSLGNRTNSQTVYRNNGVNNVSAGVYNLTPGTRYYFREVVNCGGNIQYGNILSFVTPSKTIKYTYVSKPVTVVKTTPVVCNCNNVDSSTTNTSTTVGANTQYMDLVVERLEASAVIGENANYRVIYKNISSTTLQDVVVRVILPEELSIVSADRGEYQVGGSSLVLNLGTLRSLEEGRIAITTEVKEGLAPNKQIIVNAYSNFSIPNLVRNGSFYQDEVSAYVLSLLTDGSSVNTNGNSVTKTTTTNSLSQNFIEWIILLGLVLLFILALAYIFGAAKRRNNN